MAGKIAAHHHHYHYDCFGVCIFHKNRLQNWDGPDSSRAGLNEINGELYCIIHSFFARSKSIAQVSETQLLIVAFQLPLSFRPSLPTPEYVARHQLGERERE